MTQSTQVLPKIEYHATSYFLLQQRDFEEPDFSAGFDYSDYDSDYPEVSNLPLFFGEDLDFDQNPATEKIPQEFTTQSLEANLPILAENEVKQNEIDFR